VQRFLDLKQPNRDQRSGSRLAAGVAAGVGGQAVADFLRDRSGTGERPNRSGRPDSGNRPNRPDGDRPNRPDGNRPNRPDGDRPNRPDGNRPNRPDGDRPNRPNRPDGNRPNRPDGNRPNRPDGNRPNRPDGNRPNRPDGNRPNRPDGDRPNRPDGHRPNRPNGDRPDYIRDRDRWNDWRKTHSKQIRSSFYRDYPGWRNWYGNQFWHRYPNFRWRFRFNSWTPAVWGSVVRWLPWAWSQPTYYNYGYNIYYEGDTVYYDNQPIASTEEYADQAAAIAASVPTDLNDEKIDWMPLGVFALTEDGESTGAEPTLFLQLALSKEGVIGGSLQNTETDKVVAIEGMVDKESQRAAWTIAGKTSPIMETGVANLTEDETPALVHFSDGQTQQWLMVRLDEPKETGESS
jgi:hypothetical protein